MKVFFFVLVALLFCACESAPRMHPACEQANTELRSFTDKMIQALQGKRPEVIQALEQNIKDQKVRFELLESDTTRSDFEVNEICNDAYQQVLRARRTQGL